MQHDIKVLHHNIWLCRLLLFTQCVCAIRKCNTKGVYHDFARTPGDASEQPLKERLQKIAQALCLPFLLKEQQTTLFK